MEVFNFFYCISKGVLILLKCGFVFRKKNLSDVALCKQVEMTCEMLQKPFSTSILSGRTKHVVRTEQAVQNSHLHILQ